MTHVFERVCNWRKYVIELQALEICDSLRTQLNNYIGRPINEDLKSNISRDIITTLDYKTLHRKIKIED